MNQENLYNVGDLVWVPGSLCYGKVERVRRPVGEAHYRYDIELDDGERLEYVEEDKVYPSMFEHEKDAEEVTANG